MWPFWYNLNLEMFTHVLQLLFKFFFPPKNLDHTIMVGDNGKIEVQVKTLDFFKMFFYNIPKGFIMAL